MQNPVPAGCLSGSERCADAAVWRQRQAKPSKTAVGGAHLLAGLVQARLDGPWRPRVCLSSSVGDDAGDAVSTTMVLDTGLGFRSAVWHQIAQLLYRLDEMYICDGCSRPYQRGIRKPRSDQDNFCPDCRKDGKAAKRLWAARNRE